VKNAITLWFIANSHDRQKTETNKLCKLNKNVCSALFTTTADHSITE